jgi:hypothetical protein
MIMMVLHQIINQKIETLKNQAGCNAFLPDFFCFTPRLEAIRTNLYHLSPNDSFLL